MPKPADYTPARRYVMQAVMWGMLGVTVALAAAVTRSARSAHRIELSPQTVTRGDVSVRLPTKWRPRARGDDDLRVIAQAAERGPGEPGRTVRVLSDRVESPVSPLEYLTRTFVPDSVAGSGGEPDADDAGESPADGSGGGDAPLGTIEIAGATGVVVSAERVVPRRGRPDFRKDVYAAVVLPSLRVVVVHLSGQGALDITDQAVVRQVAKGITVSGASAAKPSEDGATLPEGIQLSAPSGFAAVAPSDPNRTDRLFWSTATAKSVAELEQGWTSMEVVGCLFPHIDANDPQRLERASAALLTLLVARDPVRWRDARVMQEDNGWRADLPNPAPGDEKFAARAYLVPDPSGRALLAVLHGGWRGGRLFNRVGKELAASTRFLPSSDTAQLEDAGAAEGSRLRAAGYDKLLRDQGEQWWLWTDASERPHVGWSRLQWDPKLMRADVEHRRRTPDGDVARVTGQWTVSGDGAEYHADATHATASGPTGGAGKSIRQTVHLRGGQLSVSINATASALAQWKRPPPSQFVPGGVLPLVMGQLAPGPLLLRTDSFPGGFEAVGPLEPLTVLIRPDPRSVRRAEGELQPLRCVTAQVNGTGRVSRWYFRAAGELESVELPGGVRRQETDLNTLRFDFGKDGQMSP